MLIKVDILQRIAAGEVTLAFRQWRKPTVRTGGTLRTAIGVLAIDGVDVVDPRNISARHARAAGYETLAHLQADLSARSGDTYKIALRYVGDDPRNALRENAKLSAADVAAIDKRIASLDARGPWALKALALIAKHEGQRAADLAKRLGMERDAFKAKLRKLKELGLTESLEVGYRLSPRGGAYLKQRA